MPGDDGNLSLQQIFFILQGIQGEALGQGPGSGAVFAGTYQGLAATPQLLPPAEGDVIEESYFTGPGLEQDFS